MNRLGMTIPFDGIPLHDQRDWIEELQDLGYTDVWSSETNAHDGFVPLALASQWAPRLHLGTAIIPAYTRGPALLAQSVAALADTAPGRFTFGIGSSSNVIVERWNDVEFTEPYKRVRDTVRFLRSALAGEKITVDHDTFSVKGFRLGVRLEHQPRILVAALRPGMLGLAGREGDGAIINWLSAEDVATVVPHVRAHGDDKEIVARIMVAPTTDTDKARFVGRMAIAAYLNVPVYAEFHRWLGRADQLQGMWAKWADGDRKGALEEIPDELVDALLVHGSPEQCRDQIRRYVDNGVTVPALALVPVDYDQRQALRDLAPH